MPAIRSVSETASLAAAGAIALDHLPPHDIQMEIGVLGCILISPKECLTECIDVFKEIGKEAFYDLRHQLIYDACYTMFMAMKPVDLITVQQYLRDQKVLEEIGGISYLSLIQDTPPSWANLSYYLTVVKEKHLLRQMIHICSGVVGKIYDFKGEVDELLDQVEKEVLSVRQYRAVNVLPDTKQLVSDAMLDIEQMVTNPGKICGLSTGFPDLDKETDGLHGSEMIVIAAYPSVGKTALALNIVEHVAITLKQPVGVFSAEMSGRSLIRRALCSQGRLNLRDVRNGILTGIDLGKLTASAGRLGAAPIYIDDASENTVAQMRASARRMVQRYGIKLFIIDYIQLFRVPRSENRTSEIDFVSKSIKQMAKEFDVPVIALSQLNDEGKLKGARAIGEDADGLWVLDRESNQDLNSPVDRITLKLLKQRNAQRGASVRLDFHKAHTRFESVARIEPADVPARLPFAD